jgi:GT2 family glycosyltransferase/glycosyltransferase involved in cell wall biosynthesis
MTADPSAPDRAVGFLLAENVALREAATEAKAEARKAIDRQQGAIDGLQDVIATQQGVIDALQDRLAREKARNAALVGSTSWKLTAPVRFIKDRLQAKRAPIAQSEAPPHPEIVGAQPAQERSVAVDTSTGATDPLALTPQDRYRTWIAETAAAPQTAAPQTAAAQTDAADLAVSVLVALDAVATNDGIESTLESLRNQSLCGWQLIVVTFATTHPDGPPSQPILLGDDPRVVLAPDIVPSRGAALWAAAALATGDFVLPLDAGDRLAPHALAAFAQRLGSEPQLDILHADEDTVRDGERTAPRFKPGWSPELLAACDYFGRPTIVRRAALEAVGSFAEDLGAACEWDLHLRVAGADMFRTRTPRIGRVTDVLCHRAAGLDSSPASPAAADCREALRRYWQRQGIIATIETGADGTQHASWPLRDPPLVSAIVLNKNQGKLLRDCLDGLLAHTLYPRIEIIVVDNGSTDADTLALYSDAAMAGVRIVPFDEAFNYSRACNIGAAAATGDMLLFLNNDVEMIEPNWLDALVLAASRPGVGAVGAKLVYADGSLQHCGVVLGLHGLCFHPFRRVEPADEYVWGVLGSPSVSRNYLAVTGACLMMTRQVFHRVGGFDESFALGFSDVKLATDAWRAGYRNVYVPRARLVHHEGATRGLDSPVADQATLARAIDAAGIAEDPYFHPHLRADAAIPTVRTGTEPSVGDTLRASIAVLAPPAPPGTLDLRDDTAVMRAARRQWQEIFWNPDPLASVRDSQYAARAIIDLLRGRRDIRTRFPTALSDGKDGAFAIWLKTDGWHHLCPSDQAADLIDAAYDAEFGPRARQVILYDDDLKDAEPLILLPPGRAALVRHLFDAVAQGTVGLVDAWWMLLASDEDPAGEFVLAWRLTPAWQQQCPAGLSVFGCDELSSWVRRRFGIDAEWLDPARWPVTLSPPEQIRMAYLANPAWRARFPRCFQDRAALLVFLQFLETPEARLTLRARRWIATLDQDAAAAWLDSDGINVLGHFSYPSGLRSSVESIVSGLHRAGVATSLRDVRVDARTDDSGHDRFAGDALFDTTLVHIQPEPLFDRAMARSGLADRAAPGYRIGYWYWEFDTIPPSWDAAAAQCDELWTATEFVAGGLRARYRLPVHVLPPGLETPPFPPLSRRYFGLSDDSFVFNFTFHMASVMERKNPLGLIAAFRLACADLDDAELVIKVAFGERFSREMDALRAAAQGLNIRIIDAAFTHAETLALMAVSDAYVSLHRSEGLGLTMAEAMLLAKPTIATGYSGNLDFMDSRNSLLVDHRIVTLERDYPPYANGMQWAEPDIRHAAELMRLLYDKREFGRELGLRARMDLGQRFSIQRAGQAMADRLRDIRRGSGQDAGSTLFEMRESISE